MKTVLVAIDDSEQSREALEYALEEFDRDRLVLITIIDPSEIGYSAETALPNFPEEWYERAKGNAEDRFEDARELAADAGFEGEIDTVVEVGRPSHAIVEYANEGDVDHIVTGSHGRSGISRVLLGSVAETVVRRSPVPVTVVRWRDDEEE